MEGGEGRRREEGEGVVELLRLYDCGQFPRHAIVIRNLAPCRPADLVLSRGSRDPSLPFGAPPPGATLAGIMRCCKFSGPRIRLGSRR